MANELAGIDAKIGRAKGHLADLQQRLSVALHPDTHTFRVEFDAKTKRSVYRVYDLPVVDSEWPLLIGEVLYQLRSALDHLAWQLVELDGQTPNELTQFPVRDSLLDKNGERTSRKVLMPQVRDKEILRLVDACQPYNDLEGGEVAPFDAHRHPLWHIARLKQHRQAPAPARRRVRSEYRAHVLGVGPRRQSATAILERGDTQEGSGECRSTSGERKRPQTSTPTCP